MPVSATALPLPAPESPDRAEELLEAQQRFRDALARLQHCLAKIRPVATDYPAYKPSGRKLHRPVYDLALLQHEHRVRLVDDLLAAADEHAAHLAALTDGPPPPIEP